MDCTVPAPDILPPQYPIDHVVVPGTIEPQALHEMRFAAHADSLEKRDRGHGSGIHRSVDPMLPHSHEQVIENGLESFRREGLREYQGKIIPYAS